MAINVRSVTQTDTYWLVQLAVHEGVYQIDQYPVRVVDVPSAPADWDGERQQQQVGEFVLHSVREHMRSGALPPKGTRLKGDAVWVWQLSAPVS